MPFSGPPEEHNMSTRLHTTVLLMGLILLGAAGLRWTYFQERVRQPDFAQKRH